MNVLIRFILLTLFSLVINSDPDQGRDSVTDTRIGILGPLDNSNTGTDGANSLDRANSDQTKRVYSKHGEHGTCNPLNIFTTFFVWSAKHSEEKHPRRSRSYDEDLTSVSDQDTGSAIISVQYRDKAGQLQSLRGNAEKLLIKRRRPHIKSMSKFMSIIFP